MQVTYDLIHVRLLEGRNAESILFELFEDDDLADSVFAASGYQFDVSDSYRLFAALQDLCESARAQHATLTEEGRNRLEQGVFRLFVPELMFDDYGLRAFPEEGYMASVSAEHALDLATGFAALKPGDLSTLLSGASDDAREALQRHLLALAALLQRAGQQKLGLLIHMG